MNYAETFKALGDPIRLEMIQRLSDGSPHTVGSISENLGVTRQGARKHLQVLTEAHLVSLLAKGRETTVALNVDTLRNTHEYMSRLEAAWDQRLESLREFIEND